MRAFLKHIIIFLLMFEARLVLKKYKPKIIAITGSVGKTSTKDAIYSVVATSARARKSEKSFNSQIGIPLTILGCPNAWGNPLQWLQNLYDGLSLILFSAPYPEWLVLEVGADRPGDIRSLASWLAVDIAVITRLPEVPVHVEFFASPSEVVEEKASLIRALKPNGSLILYADDVRTRDLATRLRDKPVVMFGLSKDANVRADEVKLLFDEEHWLCGMSAHLIAEGGSMVVERHDTVGAHTLLPALAAAAVGQILGRPLEETRSALNHYDAPPGRMRLLKGKNKSLLLDDTYNSSPAATTAALDALVLARPHPTNRRKVKGRKIAVLGDMMELGRFSVEEHKKVGVHAAQAKIDILMTVGLRAKDIAYTAMAHGMPEMAVMQFDDALSAKKVLETLVGENDLVLIKGSQSTRMERVVEALMNDPSQAPELLVRQDAEWKRR